MVNESAGEDAAIERTAAPGTLAWSTAPIALHPGPNRIRVSASAASRFLGQASLVVIYTPQSAPQTPAPEIRSGFYRGRKVTYQVRNGLAIYEGDIVLGRAEELSSIPDHSQPRRSGGFRQAATIAFSAGLWPATGGVAYVPYSLSANTQTSSSAVNRINTAIGTFNQTFSGVIQWVPSTGQSARAVFDLNPSDHSGGCESNVGMTGGVQTLGGSIDCAVSVLLHEMGHAVGLWHEQSRADRDAYVNVIYSNIDKPLYYNFSQLQSNEVDLGYYDYGSIMHYFASAFSKYGLAPTLESLPAGIPFMGTEYSAGDVDAIKRLYGHAPAAVTIATNPPGGQVIVDGVTVTAPQAFNWTLNSTHTLSVPADPQTIAGQLCLFGRWTDGAGQTRTHTITVAPGSGAAFSPESAPAATVYTANFIPLYLYALSSFTSHGTATVSPAPAIAFNGQNYFENRQLVTLQAIPNSGYGFDEWYGVSLYSLTANPNALYVGSDMSSVQPHFIAAPVLKVAASVPGMPSSGLFPPLTLSVDSSPAETPANFSWTGTHTLDGTPLSASPVTSNITYTFANWSDNGGTVHSVNPPGDHSNQTITANYTATYRIVRTASPSCGGSVTSSAGQTAVNGTTASFTATPASGFTFVGWSDDLAGLPNPASYTVNDEVLATANFNVSGTTAPLAITGFSPASASVEAGSLDLVVNGTGFTDGIYAFWGNGFRSVTYQSPTQVVVHLAAGDLATAGYYDLQLDNLRSSCYVSAEADYSVTTGSAPPALTISKSHSGSFTQGQSGVVYTMAVSNAPSAGTTSGTVTVSDAVPAGLTLVSMTGAGWSCAANTCSRSDALAGGAGYPAITATFNVAADAASQLTNQATVSGGGSASATAGDPTTIVPAGGSATLSLSTAQLNFGINGTSATAPQSVLVSTTAGINWAASTTANYLALTPSGGTGTASFQVAVNPSAVPAGSPVTATVVVSAAGASNSPQSLSVVITRTAAARPFGAFDTPVNNTTVAGAIAVTGWALDGVGINNLVTDNAGNVQSPSGLQIWRSPIAGEPANNLIYVGDAIFIDGARPDVEAAYPNLPNSSRAGWGYLLLTNQLPGGGNGTFVLHAIATDTAGVSTELGTKTIVCDNAHSALPFGTIDTPAQGATVSGTQYVNYAWALTPQPGSIPADGHTLTVYIDGQPLAGHPVYNLYRSDIATLFPGFANSAGAVGYSVLDTTRFSNGLHTISWLATDSLGRQQGLGSRFFAIQNGSGSPAAPVAAPSTPVESKTIEVGELGRVELRLPGVSRGRMVAGGRTRPLPPGSTLDTKGGVFYWQLAPGFLGTYELEFDRVRVTVVVHPGREAGQRQ